MIKYGDDTQLFYAVDSLDSDSLNNLSALYPQNVIGFFAINRVSEYHTSGYGFVEQTDPLLGALLGVERDESFFIPRYVANRTVARLESTLEKRTRASEQDDGNVPKSEGETPNDVD